MSFYDAIREEGLKQKKVEHEDDKTFVLNENFTLEEKKHLPAENKLAAWQGLEAKPLNQSIRPLLASTIATRLIKIIQK